MNMTAKKCCDKCGKLINLDKIQIVWIPQNHAFSWICGECKHVTCAGGHLHG
jgi:hypothetical protein